MAYDPQTWALGVLGGTPLNAVRLNYIEQGVADAHSLIAELALANHTHTSAQITDATASNVVDTIVKRDPTGFIAVSGITGLSTATGGTQAVPKSQLDAAIAAVATASHTHTTADITDLSAVGAQVATAVDVTAARNALDVMSTSDVQTVADQATADAATYTNAREAAITTYVDDSVAAVDEQLTYWNKYDAVSGWPVRQPTTGTSRQVVWIGTAANPVPTTGTTDGGTAAAAPGDLIIYQNA